MYSVYSESNLRQNSHIQEIYQTTKGINIVNMHKDKEFDNICSNEERELSIFLYTIFQFYLEKAVKLINNTDIKMKTKAKVLIESMIENSYINYINSNKIIYTIINGILYYYLGSCLQNINQQIIDEELDMNTSPCETYFLKSLDFFNTLPMNVKIRYINYYQETFNNLGIIFFNKDDPNKGLQYFGKAEQIYKVFSEVKGNFKIITCFDDFLISCTKEETRFKSVFNFFIDGGIDNSQLEKSYTQTLFYYAQSFTRLDFKKKGVFYCCQTLKRQVDSDTYILKDAVINCINLSEYFFENKNFAQAEYLLLASLSLLPTDKKRKLKAQLQMQLGKCYLERLIFAKTQVKEQLWLSDNQDLNETLNKRICIFNRLNISFPKILDIRNKEDAKCLFRLSNTQLSRSMEYFKLEGYVTEHIILIRLVSSLYKHLIYFEDDLQRVFLMLERRFKALEPVLEQINKQAFIVQWQELTLELSEIYAEYFEKKYELHRETSSINSQTVKFGLKSIKYYSSLLIFIEDEIKKQVEEERSIEDFITIITIKLSIARLYGKLIIKEDKKQHQSYLVSSLKYYQDARESLLKSSFTKTNQQLKDQLDICEEMISMLPVKISQII